MLTVDMKYDLLGEENLAEVNQVISSKFTRKTQEF